MKIPFQQLEYRQLFPDIESYFFLYVVFLDSYALI